MSDVASIQVSGPELELIKQALSVLRPAAPEHAGEIDQLLARTREAAAPSLITIGVYGGVVQWTSGSPFPIRIIDYDVEKDELPDTDDEGHPCSIWIEPPDVASMIGA